MFELPFWIRVTRESCIAAKAESAGLPMLLTLVWMRSMEPPFSLPAPQVNLHKNLTILAEDFLLTTSTVPFRVPQMPNEDREVSLSEAYQWVHAETSYESRNAPSSQTPSFEFTLGGSGDLAITHLEHSKVVG